MTYWHKMTVETAGKMPAARYLRSLLLSEKMKSGLDEVSPHHFLKTFDFVGGLGRFRAVSRNLNLNLSLNELLLSSPAVGF